MRRSAILVLALSALGCGPSAVPERPNVVLITLDTFRPDHLGINGYSRTTAPFLERLMERSSVFDRAYSTSSWTAPATGSLFTGLYPNRHGVLEGFVAHGGRKASLEDLVGETIHLNRLPQSAATLPEILQQSGYSTFGLAANINIGSEIGFDRGFDHFRKLDDSPAAELGDVLRSEWREDLERARPYFVYLHFNDTHQPYHPRSPWYQEGEDERASSVSAYDSEISYLDGVLADLYQELNWQKNTLLLVVSDHGEELGERGRFGHGFSVRENLIRVLWVVSGPDLEIPAQRLDVPASLVDVLPTTVDLLDLPALEGVDGSSMARWLHAGASKAASARPRALFVHRVRRQNREPASVQHLWAAVRMPWKLVTRSETRPRLYDLSSSGQQRRDLAAQLPEEKAALLATLEAFQKSVTQLESAEVEIQLDQETLESLESLGYVQ